MVQLMRLPSYGEGVLFTVGDLEITPENPQMGDYLNVKGGVKLFGLPYLAPAWIVVTLTYPEKWWEEIIPIIGAPEVQATNFMIGGGFEVNFDRVLDREGVFTITARVYLGPTVTLKGIIVPPAPAMGSVETTVTVEGGSVIPEEEELLDSADFSIPIGEPQPPDVPEEEYFLTQSSFIVPVGPPASPEVTNLRISTVTSPVTIGNKCRIWVDFDYRGPSVYPTLYAAIGNQKPWFDEVTAGQTTISIPSSSALVSKQYTVDIPITDDVSPGTYDLYAKLMGLSTGEKLTPVYPNTIIVKEEEVPPPVEMGGFLMRLSNIPDGVTEWRAEWKAEDGTLYDSAQVPYYAWISFQEVPLVGRLIVHMFYGANSMWYHLGPSGLYALQADTAYVFDVNTRIIYLYS